MHYFPTVGEFAALLISSIGICGLGYVGVWLWQGSRETVPTWYAVFIALISLTLYLSVVLVLVQNDQARLIASEETRIEQMLSVTPSTLEFPDIRLDATDSRLFSILFYAFVLWFIPATYYSWLVLQSISARSAEGMPFSIGVDGERKGDFKKARALAEQGEIMEAVRTYKSYQSKRPQALLEAAKLLEADGRFGPAAELLEHLIEEIGERSRYWPEATFLLARLCEMYFDDPGRSRELLQLVYAHGPKTEFGHLALSNIERLRRDKRNLLAELDAQFDETGEQRHAS